MEAQHMSQQVFAQFIEMSPASLSSIFNGRTRPTLNIVEAIKKKIPNINTDWLMFGSGAMFTDSDTTSFVTSDDQHAVTEPTLDFDDNTYSTTPSAIPAAGVGNGVRNTHPEVVREEIKYVDKPQRKITEIKIYFDDLTYETFVPSKGK